MSLLIRHPLNLGNQTFRMSRGVPIRDTKGRITFAPRKGWWESADCRRFECNHYALGWTTTVDPTTELGQRQAAFIRRDSGRSYREEAGQDGLIRFVFEAGQKCFRDHQLPVQREPIFVNIDARRNARVMDSDEYFTTWNETIAQRTQKLREV